MWFIGVITKILDPDLYTVEVDIPEEGALGLKAFPLRGEVDEPRVGDNVYLVELDPTFHSYYLYAKLKENKFVGIRSQSKLLKMDKDAVTVGIFSGDYYDKNTTDDPTPAPSSWVKIDSNGNIDINAEGNQTVNISGNSTIKISGTEDVTVSGNVTVKTDGNASITVSGNVDIKASGNATLNSPNVTITGGNMKMKGKASTDLAGPFCAIPVCPFSGAPQIGSSVSGT